MFRFAVLGAVAVLALAGCDRGAATISRVVDGPATTPESEGTADRGASGAATAPDTERTMQGRERGVQLHGDLRAYVEQVVDDFDAIPEDRRRELRKLALFVRTKRSSGEPANLTFICTHNSRRSHMGQLWASTAAAWYGVEGVGTHSGGTEVTAFNPRAVAALERAGFHIDTPEDAAENPVYRVTFSPDGPVLEAFSKAYDDAVNPQGGFAAVMTCSEADRNCPVVHGAALRVAIPYVDPKEADGTPEESLRYDERTKQIATEMFYLFSQV